MKLTNKQKRKIRREVDLELGIKPPKESALIFLDITINRLELNEIGSVMIKLMDAIDEVADEIRLG